MENEKKQYKQVQKLLKLQEKARKKYAKETNKVAKIILSKNKIKPKDGN
jgi:hypothetical protein